MGLVASFSLSIPLYSFLSLSILSLSIPLYPSLSLSIPLYPSLSLSLVFFCAQRHLTTTKITKSHSDKNKNRSDDNGHRVVANGGEQGTRDAIITSIFTAGGIAVLAAIAALGPPLHEAAAAAAAEAVAGTEAGLLALRSLFVGLSVLNTPHMLIVFILRCKEAARRGAGGGK